jgi:hypothetical protein
MVAEEDFIYTLRKLQDPESRRKLFDSEKFARVHQNLQQELMAGLAAESDWTLGYFAPLVYLEVLHSQILGLWAAIFDLGHNGQLRILESSGMI